MSGAVMRRSVTRGLLLPFVSSIVTLLGTRMVVVS